MAIHSLVLISFVPALVLLFLYVSTFRRMCAVPKIAVFCWSQTSWCPGILLTYFLSDFEIVPVAPIITGIAVVFTFHIRCISVVRSLYFKIFSASFFVTFLPPEIATSIIIIIIVIIKMYELPLSRIFCKYERNRASWLTSIREKHDSNIGRDVDNVTEFCRGSLSPPAHSGDSRNGRLPLHIFFSALFT